MSKEISNMDSVIDSRDVIARIEELLELEDSELDAELIAELEALQAFASEGESLADWPHGETLIRYSYFESYAQELAEDCCEVPKDLKWPYTCIDWEQAANELKMDYTEIEFDGVSYYGRS